MYEKSNRPGLQSKEVSQAFEIEDIDSRQNFIFAYSPMGQSVTIIDSSRGANNHLVATMNAHPVTKKFPFDKEDAYTYFIYLYDKAIQKLPESDPKVCFLGWVDVETYEPIEYPGGVDLNEDI